MINRFPHASQKPEAVDTLIVTNSRWRLEMVNRNGPLRSQTNP
jgi:hypothetical protein